MGQISYLAPTDSCVRNAQAVDRHPFLLVAASEVEESSEAGTAQGTVATETSGGTAGSVSWTSV